MKPWKRRDHGRHARDNYWLQWGHGDEAVEEHNLRQAGGGPKRGFNGATAMKPWKRSPPQSTARIPGRLQWGHGDEAVEEVWDFGGAQSVTAHSMGPRR